MNWVWIKALALVLLFAAVVFLVERVVGAMVGRRIEGQEINKRLELIARGVPRGEAMQILRRRITYLPDGLPAMLQAPAHKLEKILMAAGVEAQTGRVLLGLVLAPLLLFLFLLLLMSLMGMSIGFGRMVMVATFAGVVGFVIPLLFFQAKAARMVKKMEDQFPVALDVFVRGLRAGHPVAAALDLLTVEMPDPIGSQFGLVVDEVTYGADLRDALTAMADRWDLEDMRMFVVSLSVQAETGGNLAEILENLSTVIRERQSMMMKVRALSSEGRMTAAMLTGLPILAFALLFLSNPGFYLDVADDPAFVPGYLFLAALYAIGVYTIRRLIDLKV